MIKPRRVILAVLMAQLALWSSCSRRKPAALPATDSKVTLKGAGPAIIQTPTAEFRVRSDGSIQGFLVKGGRKLSLDEPAGGGFIVTEGQQAVLTLDLSAAKITGTTGKLGRGKRIEIPAEASAPLGALSSTQTIEVYDDFPNVLLSFLSVRNGGSSAVSLERVVTQSHRFTATLDAATLVPGNAAKPDNALGELWGFFGSSYDWGKDDVVHLSPGFSQPNRMGEMVKGGYGGGIPVVAFWSREVGEAIGHVETLPLTLSLPVSMDASRRASTALDVPANTTLRPGDTYSTPRSFLAVYDGDFYEPLRTWSSLLNREGWELPKVSGDAYNVFWCGWGYEFNVTPAQMLGTIPKLKEFGIKWANLDDRWFDSYGDWNPRADTFPGDSIRKMVADFHRQGMLVQLWWLPLGVEDGQGHYESQKYHVAEVVKQHPDWLILDEHLHRARMVRGLAALDPSLPEVQAYYKQLTEKFIRDWDFDGSKLDNIYSVPACYNPAHHHKSPQESVQAMSAVYKTIYQTSRALKPQSVTQSCPCGTPPSLAWLPFMDQAVTADPVGAAQVRRRIKMYKALLGPESAVYGDHVELSAMTRVGKDKWDEHGQDFASTIGAGGVVGTKFVWPDPGPHFEPVNLTPAKEQHWKKWIALYNQKMLSKGTFLDLYTIGFDVPEGYAIAKDGKMYYAFFAPDPAQTWKGQIELRGLKPGTYRVLQYDEGKDLGTVEAKADKPGLMPAEFKDHLLLEVSQ
jgi:alpha-galactosidase